MTNQEPASLFMADSGENLREGRAPAPLVTEMEPWRFAVYAWGAEQLVLRVLARDAESGTDPRRRGRAVLRLDVMLPGVPGDIADGAGRRRRDPGSGRAAERGHGAYARDAAATGGAGQPLRPDHTALQADARAAAAEYHPHLSDPEPGGGADAGHLQGHGRGGGAAVATAAAGRLLFRTSLSQPRSRPQPGAVPATALCPPCRRSAPAPPLRWPLSCPSCDVSIGCCGSFGLDL